MRNSLINRFFGNLKQEFIKDELSTEGTPSNFNNMTTIKEKDFKSLKQFQNCKVVAVNGSPTNYTAAINFSSTGIGYIFNFERGLNWRDFVGGKRKSTVHSITIDPASTMDVKKRAAYMLKWTKDQKTPKTPRTIQPAIEKANILTEVEKFAKRAGRPTVSKEFTDQELQALQVVKTVLLNKAVEAIKEALS